MLVKRAAARWHQGEMLSLERDLLAGVLSARGKKFSLSSPPVCPKPETRVLPHSG